jgi:DNA repair protein RadC
MVGGLLMNQIITLNEPLDKIQSPEDLFKKIKKIDIDYDKEHFLVFTMNAQNQIIDTYIISIGILDASLIHPRETFRNAIKDNAKSIIIAHNHPSNNLTPSSNDKDVSQMLKNAGEILGISILDHIIFNKISFLSMKQHGEF